MNNQKVWGIYIYGIVDTAEEKSLGIAGITAYGEVYPHTKPQHQKTLVSGKDFGAGVYTIPYQDISAVVSDSEIVNYTTLVKDVVARYLLRHQQVIEKIMDSYTIIPMRLGTYAFNIEEVTEILCKGYMKFKDIFRKIDNKIEMDVVATWNDLNSVIKEIGEGQEIKELKEKLMSTPEGVSFEDQIKIGSFIKNILDKKREKLASGIGDVLGKVGTDIKAHDLMDDRMIFNAAFLIDKDEKAEFERRLDELNKLYNEKINFRCVGPLPTYSFYTAEVKKIPFDEIDRAKKRLCLDDVITKDEIEKAYRNLVLAYHPDRNPGRSGTEGQFDEINKACKLLLEYIMSAEQAGQGEGYPFKEEFAKNAIIVKVRD